MNACVLVDRNTPAIFRQNPISEPKNPFVVRKTYKLFICNQFTVTVRKRTVAIRKRPRPADITGIMELDMPNNTPAQRILHRIMPVIRFVGNDIIAISISILMLLVMHSFVYGFVFLEPISTSSYVTISVLIFSYVFYLLRNYGPAVDFFLTKVALIDYTYDEKLGFGPGSGAHRGKHRLDNGDKTIKTQHHSTRATIDYAMQRTGLMVGVGQEAAMGFIAYSRTWDEVYDHFWYPVVHTVLGVPVGWLPTMLHRVADNQYSWVVSTNVMYVQYIVYRYEVDGNLTNNMREVHALTNDHLLTLMKNLTQCVANVHNNDAYHGGLSTNNLFLRQQQMQLVMSDPAVANYFADQNQLPQFNSPEIYNLGAAVDARSDVYSLGRLFRLFLTGRHIPDNLDALLDDMNRPEGAARPNINVVLQRLNHIQL